MAEGATNPDETQDLTDVVPFIDRCIEAQWFETIYGVPAFRSGLSPHGAGVRYSGAVLPARTERGYAAAIAGLTKKPGLCLTVSAPGF